MLQRILPFVLTLLLGIALGSLVSGRAPQPLVSYSTLSASESYSSCRMSQRHGRHAERRQAVSVERVYRASDVTRRAVITSKPEPEYTAAARLNQVSGTVILRAVLAADGRVTSITPAQQLPHGLTEQAIEAAERIEFMPAERDGRPVSQYVQIVYNFNLY